MVYYLVEELLLPKSNACRLVGPQGQVHPEG